MDSISIAKIMFQKLVGISNYLFVIILTIYFCTFLNTSLLGSLEQNKIIRDLQNAFEETSLFYGCSFTLFDPNLPEHKEYYDNLRAKHLITTPLYERLQKELTPRKLYYFHQFKERIHVTQQYGALKKDEGDYCILYTKQFNTKTKPWDKNSYQKWYDQEVLRCNNNYENFCVKINTLESSINRGFLNYYALGKPKYDKCEAIYDHGLVQLANGNVENAIMLADEFLEQAKKENKDLIPFSSEQLLNLGITYIEAMEYSKAIDSLNASIKQDPSNKEAYFQRAIAHLETGAFDRAVSDFLISEYREKSRMQMIYKAPEKFRDAFLKGLVDGSSEAALNFFPSLFSFAYLTLAHPVDTMSNFIDASYELMHITKDYLREIKWSEIEDAPGLVHALVDPGLNKLYEKMDQLSPDEQGHLFGHTIGSFGIDLVAGVAVIKGLNSTAKLANACKTVRETGRICELETLAKSADAAEIIIAEAAERNVIRETLLQGAKSGRIVVKSPNTQFHIMQEKHAWDKVIKLTGNVEQDCKRVLQLLEDNHILLEKHRLEPTRNYKNIIRYDHQMKINGYQVLAIFNKNLETGEVFLNNAWVITK